MDEKLGDAIRIGAEDGMQDFTQSLKSPGRPGADRPGGGDGSGPQPRGPEDGAEGHRCFARRDFVGGCGAAFVSRFSRRFAVVLVCHLLPVAQDWRRASARVGLGRCLGDCKPPGRNSRWQPRPRRRGRQEQGGRSPRRRGGRHQPKIRPNNCGGRRDGRRRGAKRRQRSRLTARPWTSGATSTRSTRFKSTPSDQPGGS